MTTTRDMTKKKEKKHDTTELSSSEETASSKLPKDVLGVGKHLVRELGYEDSVDTLGRWMAHHIAELIDKVENAPSEQERIEAKTDAINLILKIWERRTTLPGNAYPLSSYKDILNILESLLPSANPFRYFIQRSEGRIEEVAADLFDHLARLIVVILLLRMPLEEVSPNLDHVVFNELNEIEQQLLISLEEWVKILLPSTHSEQTQENKSEETKNVDLHETANLIIDRTTKSLEKLRFLLESETGIQ